MCLVQSVCQKYWPYLGTNVNQELDKCTNEKAECKKNYSNCNQTNSIVFVLVLLNIYL